MKNETENHKIINTNCWVACFDMLGFKNKLFDFLTRYKGKHLDIFVKNDYLDILEKAKKGVKEHLELLPHIKVAWFSDTILFFIPVDLLGVEKGCSFTIIDSLSRQFLLRCIWGKKAIRGALSVGEFFYNLEDYVFVGPALIDAYEYAEKQEWIGLVLTSKTCCKLKEFNFEPLDEIAYTAYDVPIKGKRIYQDGKIIIPIETENLFAFKIHTLLQVEESINQMKMEAEIQGLNKNKAVMLKYENTLKFIDYCKSKNNKNQI